MLPLCCAVQWDPVFLFTVKLTCLLRILIKLFLFYAASCPVCQTVVTLNQTTRERRDEKLVRCFLNDQLKQVADSGVRCAVTIVSISRVCCHQYPQPAADSRLHCSPASRGRSTLNTIFSDKFEEMWKGQNSELALVISLMRQLIRQVLRQNRLLLSHHCRTKCDFCL